MSSLLPKKGKFLEVDRSRKSITKDDSYDPKNPQMKKIAEESVSESHDNTS